MDERKQQLIEKIKAISKPARAFIIVFAIVLLGFGTLAMVGAVITEVKGLPTDAKLPRLFEAEGKTKEITAGLLTAKALTSWVEANVLFVIGRMLGKIAETGMPFQPLGKSFRTCGVLLMLGSVAPSFIGSAVTGVLCQVSDDPLSWEFRLSLNTELLVVAVIVLILSNIFEYGALLQQETDDTV